MLGAEQAQGDAYQLAAARNDGVAAAYGGEAVGGGGLAAAPAFGDGDLRGDEIGSFFDRGDEIGLREEKNFFPLWIRANYRPSCFRDQRDHSSSV
jgi:hypothetical protein